MAELILGGSIPALVTPFAEGVVDHAALRDLVVWQIAQGSSAIVVCGTTGEGGSLGEDERVAVIAQLVGPTQRWPAPPGGLRPWPRWARVPECSWPAGPAETTRLSA